MRFLTSIQETAVGIDSPQVTLPAVQFQYHDATVNLIPPGSASGIPWVDEPLLGEPVRRNNLAWGRRYDDDRFPTVEAMLVDVDGDSLLDRVMNASTPAADGQCRAKWQRNLGPTTGSGGVVTFAAPVELTTLPRIKWHHPTATSGGAVSSPAMKEGCSLNGQVTAFVNSAPADFCHNGTQPVYRLGSNPGPYCDPGGTEPPTTSGTNPPEYRTYLVYRWQDVDSDGLVDLVAAVHGNINKYDVDQGNLPAFLGVPEGTFSWPACPAIDRCKKIDPVCATARRSCPVGQLCAFDWTEPDSMTSCITQASQAGCDSLINNPVTQQGSGGGSPPPTTMFRHAYTRCDGLYPWFIYKNLGYQNNQIQFATTPVIKYQPVPLESDTGDSSILARGVMSQSHAVMDFDGDGILDAVARPRGSDEEVSFLWNVWLGDGTGGFGPQRYIFPTRNGPHNRISGFGLTWGARSASSDGLLDVNGDGLPDHWLTPDWTTLHNANIAFHDGTQHRLVGQASPPLPKGELETPSSPTNVKPGNDTIPSEIMPTPLGSQQIDEPRRRCRR